MITKPEDAVPHKFSMMVIGDITVNGREWFTAAECAEIAKAYAQDQVTIRRGTAMQKAMTRERVIAWDKRFAQWEGK